MTKSPADVEGLVSLRRQLERIADRPANEQPCYPDGVRPFGGGDLRHYIATLDQAAARLTALERQVEEMRGALTEAARALESTDDAMTAMADAGATPAHGTWGFVTKAHRKARAALSTQKGSSDE